MMPETLFLTPLTGSLLVLAVVVCGYRFRDLWKRQPEGWQKSAWFYGLIAGLGLLALSFIPLQS